MRDTEYIDTPGGSPPRNNGHPKTKRSSLLERLPPHSPEAEQGVLGCILLDPSQSMPACIEKLQDGALVFYDLRHQEIFSTFCELFEEGDAIDTITVCERLKLWQKLEQVGGVSYISILPDCVPSAANLPYYLDIIRGKNTLRKMIRTCTDVVTQIYDCEGTGDVDELMDHVESQVLQISESRVEPVSLSIQSLVHQSMEDFERAFHHEGLPQGITTGFADFDKMTDGLHAGEFIVLAARPAIGKTSLALNIAEHAACTLHLPVGIISLEMTAKELTKRMICSRSRVNMRNVREGFLAERDVPKLASAAHAIRTSPIFIDDIGGQSILQIRAKARRWWQQEEIRLLVIDYLQLANAEGGRRKYENRQQEVSQISVGCKNLAKELGIPVLGLCQLNRDIERDKHRKPRLSDLRESGSLEQDADLVAMLYKPRSDDDDDQGHDYAEPVNLLIAKSRNGPTGDVNLTFLKCFTRFESAAKVTDDDTPPSNNGHYQPEQQQEMYATHTETTQD